MMQNIRTSVAALAGAALVIGGATLAQAQATKESLGCAASKLGAIGKDIAGQTKCYGKAAGAGTPVDPACLQKVTLKTADTFAKIEAKGGCATDANSFDTNNDTIPDGQIGSIRNQIDNGFAIGTAVIFRGLNGPIIGGTNNEGLMPALNPLPASPSKCASKKIGAAGKLAAAIFKCESKSAKKNLPSDQVCIDKAIGKLTASFTKEDAGADCQVTGDGTFAASEIFRQYQRIVPSVPRFDGCGNTLLTAGESCDDGNTANFDSCPSDCTIDACTPTANPQPVTVTISDPAAAGATIELDYPEGKVLLPGLGFEADVTNLTAGLMTPLDFEHAIRIVVTDAAAFGQVEMATLNFVDCQGATPPVVGDFTCAVTDASGAGGTPLSGVTCTVTIP